MGIIISIMNNNLELLQVVGDDFECGQQVGVAHRDLLTELLEMVKESDTSQWDEEVREALCYLPATQYYFPYLVDQLRGIAVGSGQKFEAIFALAVEEEPNGTHDPNHCTDIVSVKGSPIIFHNNDNRYPNMIRAVEWKSSRGTTLTVGLGPFACVGVSQKPDGTCLALSGNDLSANDEKSTGVTRWVLARAILEASDLSEAVRLATHPERASSYHNVIADENSVVCLEGSATDCRQIMANNDFIVHANAYIHPEMKIFENQDDTISSQARLARGQRMCMQVQRDMPLVSQMLMLLKDHGEDGIPSENTICRHGKVGTVFSSIIDMGEKTVSVALGNPCKNEYQVIWRFN